MVLTKVRIDQWLWAIRIFKTRSKSTAACKAGKVRLNNKTLKPSFLIKGDEIIQVSKNGFNLQFKVKTLINKRVGFPIAQTCYVDHTPEEEKNKYKDWFIGKAGAEHRARGLGRPSKKDRRDLDEFKIAYLEWDHWDD